MTERVCQRTKCGKPIPSAARSHAKYCGASCRVMAAQERKRAASAPAKPAASAPAEFPARLTALPRWVRHDSKRPVTITGDPASSVNDATWSEFEAARDSAAGDGLGFVFVGDGIGCIDLDHCIDEFGTLSADAERVLAALPPTYVEVSLSGTGLHIIGTGIHLSSRQLRGALQGEVIGSRKFVALTGRVYRSAPLRLGNIGPVARSLLA